MEERYYFGQGQVFIREKTKTNDQPWRWLGDVSSLVLSAEGEEVLKHKEHYSGQRKVVRSIRFGGEQTLSATLYQIDNHNLAMAARGTITDIPAATITGEVLGTVKAGDVFLLQSGYNATDLVITDAGAVELPVDHYDFDARTGIISIIDLPTTAPTFPLKASYKHTGANGVVLFNSALKDLELRYDGINLAENGESVIVELYKVSPGNLQNLSLISEDTSALANMPWTADVLADTSKPSSGDLGQVGRFLQVNPA